jgi:hypothetical protein
VTPRDGAHERVYRALLRLYPAAFRERFSDAMVQHFGDQLRDARTGRVRTGVAMTWLRTLGDLAVTAASERVRGDWTVAHSLTAPPSVSTRVLGLAGILSGAFLLVPAFLPALVPFEMTPDLFNLRLVVFNAGAIAIVIGVHRRQVSAARWLAWSAAIPAVLANAWYLALVVRLVGQPGQIGAGDYGPNFLSAAIALWLTDSWFGIVTARLGVVTRLGGLLLAIGSTLAMMGIAQFGLTSEQNPTIFGSLAILGIALNGIAWIALGFDLAMRRRAVEPPAQRVRPGT